MYLWRNLPEGHLSAVLRWICERRAPVAPAAKTVEPAPLAPVTRDARPPLPR